MIDDGDGGDRAAGAAHAPVQCPGGGTSLCSAASHIDQMILACFVLGLSTRKVATALQPVLGRRISPDTVS